VPRRPQRPAAFADIESLPQRFERIEADLQAVKNYIATHGA